MIRSLKVAIAWVLSLMFCATAAGQELATAPASRPAATAPASPIPLGEVTSQADAAGAMVRSVETELASDHAASGIVAGLPGLAGEVDARAEETSKALAAAPSLATLRRLEPRTGQARGAARSACSPAGGGAGHLATDA